MLLEWLILLHSLCQEPLGELALTQCHHYKLGPDLQHSASQDESLRLCFFYPLFSSREKKDLAELDWGIRNVHCMCILFKWTCFKLQVCSVCPPPFSTSPSRYPWQTNVSLKSPQLQTMPPGHDRNLSYHWKDSSVAPAVCSRAFCSWVTVQNQFCVTSVPPGLLSPLPSPTIFPWRNAEGWKTATWGPEPWKDVVGVQGKQSKRHEKAVPPAPPTLPTPGPPEEAGAGAGSRATGLFDCLSLVARQ